MFKKIVGGVIGLIIGYFIASHFLGIGISIDKKISKMTEYINKQCPIMVDKETRLDYVVGGPGKKITYVYTLVNYNIGQIDIEYLESAIRPKLIEEVRAKKELDALKKENIDIAYVYNSKDQEEIMEVLITPSDYK